METIHTLFFLLKSASLVIPKVPCYHKNKGKFISRSVTGEGMKIIRKKWKEKRKGKLIYEYLLVLLVVIMVVLASFFVTSHIARTSAMDEARQGADVVFQQAISRVGILEDDVKSLYTNTVYNESVRKFLKAKLVTERWEIYNEWSRMAANNMRVNQNLRNTALYDGDDKLVASHGSVFLDKQTELEEQEEYTYSGIITDPKYHKGYFQVVMPIYDKAETGVMQQIGSASLLFSADDLQHTVEDALLNEKSCVAIVDRSRKKIVSAGNWNPMWSHETENREDKGHLIYAQSLGETGWTLISVVPKESLLGSVTQMQKINYFIFGLVFALMIFLCSLVYERVIKPISRQAAFMANFKKDTRQRLAVKQNNEIGELAGKMNQMLDDIEELNRAMLDTKEKYLELEYAKKQTEMIAYRSQINPHFLSNTFNCIRGMALYHGDKDIAELTVALASFFRYTISAEEMVTIQEALENLRKYAVIIQYRFNGKHQIEMEADRELLAIKIPKMLLQPLVENAVLHGLERKVDGGKVWVRFTLLDSEKSDGKKRLKITVENNGEKISDEVVAELKTEMESYDQMGTIPDKKHGIGMLNVYRRMRLFYGERASFEIRGGEVEGTIVEMTLPVEGE